MKLGPGTLRVTFKAPVDNGAPVTKYAAACLSSRSHAKTQVGNSSPITVTGLNPATWSCTIIAANSRGAGLPSAASAGVKI